MRSAGAKLNYLNLYFQVHQPRRLNKFQFFDIGSSRSYFDDDLNTSIITRIAQNCYIPANKMLLNLIQEYPDIKITFSISGIALEQLNTNVPEVIESFRELANTGSVEFLGETYFHSLAFLIDDDEFKAQILQHSKIIQKYFGQKPSNFRNTELLYSNDMAVLVSKLGFKGIYLEGIKRLSQNFEPNRLYKPPGLPLVLYPRNYILSDDIAFRYSNRNWNEWPLTPNKYLGWLENIPGSENYICIGMDYETLGEHHREADGILNFMKEFIANASLSKKLRFVNPTGAGKLLREISSITIPGIISWADVRKDTAAWLGNELQQDAFTSLKNLYPLIKKIGDAGVLKKYRYLQTSDHFYYMSKQTGADGQVHQYFSHYNSAYEAFLNYMNVLADLEWRLKTTTVKT